MFKSYARATLILMTGFVLVSCAGLTVPEIYAPPSGQGPLVLMLSGRTGQALYIESAKRLADSGFRVLLTDSNEFPINETPICQDKISAAIKDHLPKFSGTTRKVVVIGYSLGGAVALSCAAGLPEVVAGVIAYYPATRLISNHEACVERFGVPITVLQGEADRYFDCCTVEKIREMQLSARKKGRDFELIVYPGAGHGFNLGPMKDKQLDDDSWRKTMEALNKYLH